MVAGAQQQHPQTSQSQHQQPQHQLQQQHQQQQLPTATLSSAQDEALKRNTDCVYFLASPLTCKKGSECEYRHSEYARVNPRDCWYWLNGNCLNPKCSFRHPPLDSFIGTPGTPTAAGQFVPLPQIVASSATHAPYNSSKQAVPCIFFQKGLCLKGDRCAFLHGPSPSTTNNKVSQVPLTSQVTEPPSIKRAFGGLEKCKQEMKIPQANVAELVEGSEAKPAPKVETQSNKNVVGMAMHVPLPPSSTGFKNEGSRFKVASTPPVTNGTSVPRSHRARQAHVSDDHSLHTGKDGDEFLRESSPGFDVLVADELRNSDYYHGEDVSNLDSVNEYDLGHPDYNPIADIDRERFRVQQGYDLYDHMQESYAREQHRSSSERIYGASAHLERRTHRRSNSPENVEVLDLRHHLSKRRRVSGLKSVVSHDYAPESHGEEQGHWFPWKELHQLPLNESSLSNRLRGRIKLPANGGDNHLEREADRGRNRSRLSPGRLQTPHQGRLRDRLRGSVHDDYERKNFRGIPMRREIIGDSSIDFSGPKSLAELKVGKNTDNKEEQSLGKRKSSRDHRQYDDDLLFDGPKPLSEILKEKRGTGVEASSQSVKLPDNRRDIKDSEAATGLENNTATTEAQIAALAATKQDVPINEGESNPSEVGIDIDKSNTAHGQLSEDGIIYDETTEDQEYKGDDNQMEGDYDYEQGDEGDYNYDEGENAEQDEYIDDEDGDDFAKKIGVVLL